MVIKADQIVPVIKPVGYSTYDLVRVFKRETKFKGKIGHGGTLDPFATGVALLLLGKSTSRFEEIRSWTKVYLCGVRLGASSSTQDVTGTITPLPDPDFSGIDVKTVESALTGFVGKFEQKVPAYSAAKHEGVPMYKLARRGKATPEKSKTVEVFSIELVSLELPMLAIRVTCGGGVYIRQLGEDLAEKLGTTGFLNHLERERVGDYGLRDCLNVEDFKNLSFTD